MSKKILDESSFMLSSVLSLIGLSLTELEDIIEGNMIAEDVLKNRKCILSNLMTIEQNKTICEYILETDPDMDYIEYLTGFKEKEIESKRDSVFFKLNIPSYYKKSLKNKELREELIEQFFLEFMFYESNTKIESIALISKIFELVPKSAQNILNKIAIKNTYVNIYMNNSKPEAKKLIEKLEKK